MPSILDLEKVVSKLDKNQKSFFKRFFTTDSYTGEVVIPKEMKAWATKQFGSVSNVSKQKIIRVTNNFTFEGALFNELRAKRPMVKGKDDWKGDVKNSQGGPFCKPKTSTPEDVFGRVKGKHSISASNVAKYDKWHGLVVFEDHDPLNFTQASIADYFETAKKWIARAHKRDKNAKYPFVLWNCLWKSSSSIIHGHIQTLLARKNHYAAVEMLNKTRQDYMSNYGTDYFEDLFNAHKDVGLGFKKGSIQIMCNLTPRKEKEMVIVAPSVSKDFSRIIYKALKTFRDDLGVESFNVGLMMPPVTNEHGWEGFPVIARIVDRGSLSSKTSDIGGMELYAGTAVVSSDPFIVAKKLKKNL